MSALVVPTWLAEQLRQQAAEIARLTRKCARQARMIKQLKKGKK